MADALAAKRVRGGGPCLSLQLTFSNIGSRVLPRTGLDGSVQGTFGVAENCFGVTTYFLEGAGTSRSVQM